VMLIGHNPAIQDLTLCLTGGGGELAGRKFPTGALATLTFTGPWRALEPRHAGLAAFITPRELS
jgi:phosphohistidine phosphatase